MKRLWICVFMIGITTICHAAWDKTKPTNGGMIKNGPAEIRANWDAIELCTDSALQITNDKISATAAIADTKLATISTAGKVRGEALTLLPNVPAGAGALPVANGGTGSATQNFVDLTTTQTVAGAKTFTTIPILPASDPTTDNQTVRKAYVDGYVNAKKLNGFTNPDGAVNFNGQQATALVIENKTSDPVSPVAGQIWYRSDL